VDRSKTKRETVAVKATAKKRITPSAAIKAINQYGILLTFPQDNREEPKSIWSVFYPGEKMLWEWDDNGDDRVARLWQLRTELSTSREVVYAKWFRGRATFFSREVFTALLAYLGSTKLPLALLPREAQQMLEVLEMDSPQSTKQLKLATELRGKTFERIYERSLKSLWSKLLVVGFGEFDDGAFPSLAIGSTKSIFEDLWEDSLKLTAEEAKTFLNQKLGEDSIWLKKLSGKHSPARA
jgi:hypothetical protein